MKIRKFLIWRKRRIMLDNLINCTKKIIGSINFDASVDGKSLFLCGKQITLKFQIRDYVGARILFWYIGKYLVCVHANLDVLVYFGESASNLIASDVNGERLYHSVKGFNL